MVEGYCMKCKAHSTMKDAKHVTMKNGKPATEGRCTKCGTKMFKIGKAGGTSGGRKSSGRRRKSAGKPAAGRR